MDQVRVLVGRISQARTNVALLRALRNVAVSGVEVSDQIHEHEAADVTAWRELRAVITSALQKKQHKEQA
jgi:hypothetical protein